MGGGGSVEAGRGRIGLLLLLSWVQLGLGSSFHASVCTPLRFPATPPLARTAAAYLAAAEGVTPLSDEALETLSRVAGGDMRRAITTLQVSGRGGGGGGGAAGCGRVAYVYSRLSAPRSRGWRLSGVTLTPDMWLTSTFCPPPVCRVRRVRCCCRAAPCSRRRSSM